MTTTTVPGVSSRAATLEGLLGSLDDPANPIGRDALLTADEHWELVGEGEDRLAEFGIGAELVPSRYGGRFEALDGLGRILRPVFRRDPALGFSTGLLSFIASSMVWLEGDEQQCGLLAGMLLANERVTLVRREESHANDLTREELSVAPEPDGWVLNGFKSAIANADRARGLVVMARQEDGEGPGAYSVLLVDRDALPDLCLEELPRYPTVGMRGCWFGGLEFVDCPLPPEALVGAAGRAVQIGLRGSGLVRGLVVSTQIASGDTILRTAVRFVAENGEAGERGQASGHETTVLAGALLDTLVGDCLALAACRAVHVVPEDSLAVAAAAAYVVPKLLAETSDNLTVVLGNAQYMTTGPYGMFQKHLRDLPVTGLGHSGSAGRQATLVTNLPRFAERSWFRAPEPDPALFQLDGALPPLALERLTKVVGDTDPLAAALLGGARMLGTHVPPGTDRRRVATLRTMVDLFVAELDNLRRACVELGVQGRQALLTPQSYALADRYALVCAAAAVLGVWRDQQGREDGRDPFLADPRWAIGALTRLGKRLDLPLPPTAADYEEWVLDEAFRRYHANQSFDLYCTRLA
ncbi:acyl-CoA dehydrogenase [Catenulispora yoronensis]|uniref:Acyl-CoA dehydrogenase n=1 Tax=Catenulispora yoronensis TaxID=450799 RepID=A0ABP5GS13_9ACTN